MFFSGQGYAADLKSKGKDIADLVRDAGENSMILVDGTHTITKTIKMQKGQSLVGKNYLEGEKDAEIGGLATCSLRGSTIKIRLGRHLLLPPCRQSLLIYLDIALLLQHKVEYI